MTVREPVLQVTLNATAFVSLRVERQLAVDTGGRAERAAGAPVAERPVEQHLTDEAAVAELDPGEAEAFRSQPNMAQVATVRSRPHGGLVALACAGMRSPV